MGSRNPFALRHSGVFWRRVARAVAIGSATLLLCVLGLVLSLNTSVARTLVADAVNRSLAGYFCGQVTLEHIEQIGLSGIDGIRLSVDDPAGNRVLSSSPIDAQIRVLPALHRLLTSRGSLTLAIDELSIGQLALSMQADATETLNLQRAFRICAPTTPSSQSVHFAIKRIRIARLLGNVEVLGMPSFDAQLKDIEGSLILIPGKLAIEVDRFSIETRGLIHGADLDGTGRIKFVLPLASPGELLARVHWGGLVYGTEVSAEVQWLAGLLRVGLDAPRISTRTVRRFWPGFPEGPDADAHIELQGTPPKFALKARVARARGSLELTGRIQLGTERRADLQLALESFDVEQVFAGTPRTSLNASAEITAHQLASGATSGELSLELPSSTIADVPLAPAAIRASFLHVPGATSNLDATLVAREPGAPAQLKCRLTSNAKRTELSFDGDVRAARLDQVPRLAGGLRGAAIADLQGTVDLSRGTLNARVAVEATELRRGSVAIGGATLQAVLRGPLKAPRADLSLTAKGLALGSARFSELHAEAHGSTTSTRISANLRAADGASVTLGGLLGIDEALTVRDLVASFDRRGNSVNATARAVRVRDSGIAIEQASIQGLGEPLSLDLAVAPRELRVRALGKQLDVARIVDLTQLGDYGGQLDLDVDLSLTPRRNTGRIAVSLRQARAGPIRGLSTEAEAVLQDRDFTAHVRSDFAKGTWFELQTEQVRLGGPADELASWLRWSGRVAIDASANLVELQRHLSNLLPVSSLRGDLSLHADLSHEANASPRPNAVVSIQGAQLGFTPGNAHTDPGNAKAGIGPEPRFRDLEGRVSLIYDGDSEQTRATAQVSDRAGLLAAFDFTADEVPYGTLLTSPREGLNQLAVSRSEGRLTMPRRSLSSMPGELVPPRVLGELQSSVTWKGTAAEPAIDLQTSLIGARIRRGGLAAPLDVSLLAHYDGEQVDGRITAALDGRTVVEGETRVQTRAADWVGRSQGSPMPWEASGRARLTGLPLERIRQFGDSEVSGLLSGEFEIEGLNRDASANLRLETQKLRVRDLLLTAGSAQVVLRPNSYDARVRLEERSAYAEARLSGASRWGAALLPSMDDTKPQRAALSANRFRIATLLPFTGGLFSDLDGRLDAEISAEVDRRARATRLSGVASLQGGVFELTAGGGEFHDVDAKLVLKPDGTVQLQSLTAQGVSGRLHLTASARFDGTGWASSEAHLWIPANDPIPLTLEGAGYGSAFGRIDLLAVRAPNRRDVLVDIDVPSLNVMLPTTASRTVRQLEPMQGVRLGSRQQGGEFVTLGAGRRSRAPQTDESEPPAQVSITFNLGKEVKVTRGNSLEVVLTGHPRIVLSDQAAFSGQVQLVRGFLDIEGKRFDIERGTVTFVGDDPTNPQADVTASWTAPDGTIVYAEFSGPLQTGKVTLHSDPPLPKNEILSLMLFGGSDKLSTKSSNQAKASGSNVIGVAQGAATQPINHALQDYGLRGISTRVDTSTVNPRPEVEVRIARDVALQIAWVLGTPPPGSNPDKTLFTIDWRFFRRWSLETTVGDAGTSIADVVWQYGY